MNKQIKIILLFVAVIVAIVGVLSYMKTIVSPPRQLHFENQFEAQLKKDIEAFKHVEQDSLDTRYFSLTDKDNRFKSEAVIDQKSYVNNYFEIICIYAPKFAQYCFSQFEKSVWYDDDLKWMEVRISVLRAATIENRTKKMMDTDNLKETDNQFTTILETIQKYRKAKSLSQKTSYLNLNNAKVRIEEAKQYKQDNYLKNNQSLMKALNKLPGKLEASHYAYLLSEVNKLANYDSYSEAGYDTLSDQVNAALKEYKQNAQSVYGTQRSLDDLEAKAARYEKRAKTYYEYRYHNSY